MRSANAARDEGLERRRAEEHDRRRAAAEAGEASPYLLAEAGGAVFCIDVADRGISRKLFVRGRIAVRPGIERAVETLERAGAPLAPGALFVDVGAHIGTATVSALRHCGFGAAIAFEPDPGNFRLLQVNLLLNGLAESVTPVNAAVSDREDRIPFLLLPGIHGGHKVISAGKQRRYRARRPSRDVIEVDSVTLDAAFDRHGLSEHAAGLVKIDAQGHEPEILEGATRLASAGAPLLIEYWPTQLEKRGRLERFEELVGERFASIFDLGRRDADPAERIPAGDIRGLRALYRDKDKTDLLLLPAPESR